MKKQTILTRAALLIAPFALAATFGTSVVSHADSDDDMVTTYVKGGDNSPEANAKAAAYNKAAEATNKQADKVYAEDYKDSDKYMNDNSSTKKTKKHAKKATKKHVAKKRIVRKHARKHARRLFRIRVKAHRIYAYKTSNFRHHKGRRVERKGTKLYVYGIVKKGHKTYYKVYGGRVITSYHKCVTKIAK